MLLFGTKYNLRKRTTSLQNADVVYELTKNDHEEIEVKSATHSILGMLSKCVYSTIFKGAGYFPWACQVITTPLQSK